MAGKFSRESFDPIYQMLFELAKGNFTFQIEHTNDNDEMAGLKVLLNLTAQKLKRNRNQFLWLNKDRELVKIQTASFLLDSESKIVRFQSEMEYFKGKAKRFLHKGKKFPTLLSEESKTRWSRSINNLANKKRSFLFLPLQYSIYQSLHLRLHSVITKITCEKSEFYMIHSSQLNLERDDFFNAPEIKSIHTLSIWDQKLFQDIHSYISNHLDESLISYYELASLFNTNEHKIKIGFKEAYGLTPFQVHREKRIEHSKILMANTDLSFNEIALKMGFSTYPQFSRTFKIITGYSPNTFKKQLCN